MSGYSWFYKELFSKKEFPHMNSDIGFQSYFILSDLFKINLSLVDLSLFTMTRSSVLLLFSKVKTWVWYIKQKLAAPRDVWGVLSEISILTYVKEITVV